MNMHLLSIPVAAMVLSCIAPAQEIAFSDQSAQFGVLHRQTESFRGDSISGGAGWLDYNQDGLEDLLVTSNAGNHVLYRNDFTGFTDVTAGSGLTTAQIDSNYGVIIADYNQDGLPDIYLTNIGPNQLFTNQGNGKFVDDAVALGVADSSWSQAASWADFDRDGDLDLYVGNYIDESAGTFFPYHYGARNMLYENMGSSVTPQFQEKALQLGVANVGIFGPPHPLFINASKEGQATAGATNSVCTLNFDEDGDQDLMVGNDHGEFMIPDKLYRNDTPVGGPLKFTDISSSSGFEVYGHYDMGINGSDYDLDGDWDFYKTNIGTNLLLQNNGGVFTDVAATAGPLEENNESNTLMLSSWASIWNDFNHDLWEDLFVVNGYIPSHSISANDTRAPNHVWTNQKNGTFLRVDPVLSGVADEGLGRAVAASDFNGDGWMDFYVSNNANPRNSDRADRSRLFVNEGLNLHPERTSTMLRLFGWKSNREGIGTLLLAEVNNLTLRRQVLADPVYQSSSTRMVHFGNDQFKTFDKLTAQWPSGLRHELHGIPTGTVYHLHEPQVTLDRSMDPQWDPNAEQLNFPVQLTNHSNNLHSVQMHMFFYLGENGPLCLVLTDNTSIAPNHQGNFHISLDLPKEAHNMIQGLGLVQRTYIKVIRAYDSRSTAYNIP